MNRLLAALLSSSLLLAGCVPEGNDAGETDDAIVESSREEMPDLPTQRIDVEFDNMGDPELLQYVQDAVFATIEEELSSDDYVIESVVATYASKEYLEEFSYNSQGNLYFGHTLSDIEAQFDGEKYVFGLDESGETEVRSFEAYDDTLDQVLENVAVGSGVILVCVTASVISGSLALPGAAAVSTIFAASAKTGTAFALNSGALGTLAGGAITGFMTGDIEAALKSAVLSGSEGFKWGAITGVISGGVSQALQLRSAAPSRIPTPHEAEAYALQKYGGRSQVSYLGGREVPQNTAGSTRPDIVRMVDGKLEAIEVKSYDLEASSAALLSILKSQVSQRQNNLPEGAVQLISLDVRGRNYSRQFMEDVRKYLTSGLEHIYPQIPIEFMR